MRNELVYSQPKPRPVRKKQGPVARYRAKRKRADDAVRLEIRRRCVLRDGYCKFAIMGGCDGPSEHAHLGRHKRARTRGMDPTDRHTMEGSCMLCERHHGLEERGTLQLAMFGELGANGPIRIAYQGRVFMVNG